MAFSEKEMQYTISKYPSEFFNFPIEIIATEVSLPKDSKGKRYRADILARDNTGFIIIELKTKPFNKIALDQLENYSIIVNKHWGKVSKIIGMSPMGSKLSTSDNHTFIELSDDNLQRIKNKYHINFNDVLSNSENLARETLVNILQNASVKQLRELFSKTKYLFEWNKIERTNYQAIYKYKPIKLKSSFYSVNSQNRGIDIVARNNENNFEFELKVRSKLGKEQLNRYKQNNSAQLLFLVSNNLRHYYEQLFVSKAFQITWDEIYDAAKNFSFLTEEDLNNLNRYRFHFYQKVADKLYEKAFIKLNQLNKTEYLRIEKKVNNNDMDYYFLFYSINKDYGPISKILTFAIGMHADTCDRLAVRILNPEDYFDKYPQMEKLYKSFLFNEHLNLSGMEISKHPYYSFDVSHIRSLNDISENEINKFVKHILKTTNKYCSVLEQL